MKKIGFIFSYKKKKKIDKIFQFLEITGYLCRSLTDALKCERVKSVPFLLFWHILWRTFAIFQV